MQDHAVWWHTCTYSIVQWLRHSGKAVTMHRHSTHAHMQYAVAINTCTCFTMQGPSTSQDIAHPHTGSKAALQFGTCLVRMGSVQGLLLEAGSILLVVFFTFDVRCALNGTMPAVNFDRIAPNAHEWLKENMKKYKSRQRRLSWSRRKRPRARYEDPPERPF